MHASPNMCRFQMRSCIEDCAISRREIDEKYLIHSRNYSIPHRNEEKKTWFLRYWFSGFNSKISMITSSSTWKSSFTYSAWLIWLPLRGRTVLNVQSPSLKTSNEEFLRKITYFFRDYCLFVCLFVIVWRAPLIERAERTDWINVRRINSAILPRKWRLH